jgi:hypothetical protein
MKLQRAVIATLTLAFAFALVNCGEKTEKDRVIDAYAGIRDCLDEAIVEYEPLKMPEDSKKIIASTMETQTEMVEIAKEHGFKNAKALGDAAEKYEDDPDLKKLKEECRTLNTKYMQLMEEKIR